MLELRLTKGEGGGGGVGGGGGRGGRGGRGARVTSLRTLCARVSSKEQTRRNFGRNIVLKETATNTEETVLCGPSEI